MFYEDDWLMRQINMMVKAVAQLACGKDFSISYDLHRQVKPGEEGSDLRSQLLVLISQNRLCDAEDLLYGSLPSSGADGLKIGLDFYATLNCLPDQTLEEGHFPRDEIQSGLEDLMHFYGIFLEGKPLPTTN